MFPCVFVLPRLLLWLWAGRRAEGCLAICLCSTSLSNRALICACAFQHPYSLIRINDWSMSLKVATSQKVCCSYKRPQHADRELHSSLASRTSQVGGLRWLGLCPKGLHTREVFYSTSTHDCLCVGCLGWKGRGVPEEVWGVFQRFCGHLLRTMHWEEAQKL